MTRRLAREEGLLVGGSCGMAAVAALRVAAAAGPDDVVVVLLPDGGRGYLSKIFNDDWMADYGFLSTHTRAVGRRRPRRARPHGMPSLVHTHPHETVREAIDILREYGVSQMPVVKAEPPVMAAEVVGSVVERDLLDALFGGPRRAGRPRRAAHVARRCRSSAPASRSLRRSARWRRRTRPWCSTTASPSACSPGRTCWASSLGDTPGCAPAEPYTSTFFRPVPILVRTSPWGRTRLREAARAQPARTRARRGGDARRLCRGTGRRRQPNDGCGCRAPRPGADGPLPVRRHAARPDLRARPDDRARARQRPGLPHLRRGAR